MAFSVRPLLFRSSAIHAECVPSLKPSHDFSGIHCRWRSQQHFLILDTRQSQRWPPRVYLSRAGIHRASQLDRVLDRLTIVRIASNTSDQRKRRIRLGLFSSASSSCSKIDGENAAYTRGSYQVDVKSIQSNVFHRCVS